MHTRQAFFASSLLFCLSGCASVTPRPTPFIGGTAGIATLSADARANVTATAVDVSLYKPENGSAINLLAGLHLTDYFSVQANYVWNRNTLTIVSSSSANGMASFFEERRNSTQHAIVADALLYFRNRESWARPYLSSGVGLVRLQSDEPTLLAIRGEHMRPPATFVSTKPAVRVAVGIDLDISGGWRIRYTFSETIRKNAVSARLSPPAVRNLANFQNLFGVTKSF